MTNKESIPPGDLVGKKNTPASDTMYEGKARVSDGGSLPRLMGPLTIRSGNTFCPLPVEDRHSPEVTKRNKDDVLSRPQDHDELEQNNQPEPSDDERSDFDPPDDNINDEQEDEDGYDFDCDSDDISIDDDDFFGDAVREVAPCQPTEEQMEAIRKTMEEDEKAAKKVLEEKMNQEAISKVLAEDAEPPALVSNNNNDDTPSPIVPPHPLLTDQNYNATETLISIRSSFGGDVYHIVGMTEPLLEMKMKFIKAVNLSPSQLGKLEFLCGYHVIQDDDTAEKLKISPESIIHCQKIGAMRYDLPPRPQSDSRDSE